jgi:hypothetical protein
VKYRTLPSFDADLARLAVAHRRLFVASLPDFVAGCDRLLADGPSPHPWPGAVRVHQLKNSRVWSMTWHYRRPDGRATFEFVEVNGELLVQWRRIGSHEIYDAP